MSPFIKLKRSSQYGGTDEYLVNVNHIVRIVNSTGGSQVFTVGGDFFSDESPTQIMAMIDRVFELIGFTINR